MKENTTFIYSSNVVQGQVTTNAESRANITRQFQREATRNDSQQRWSIRDKLQQMRNAVPQTSHFMSSSYAYLEGVISLTSTNPGKEIKISHGLVEIPTQI